VRRADRVNIVVVDVDDYDSQHATGFIHSGTQSPRIAVTSNHGRCCECEKNVDEADTQVT